ncbi:MAG: hypothetical protein ACYC46_14425 [Acidobacteriaceae bacterium]
MTDTLKPQTDGMADCAEFQQQLPDILAAGEIDISDHPHLKTCANCAALLRDLQYIAETAKQLLPVHDPSPDVWSHIQNALAQEGATDVAKELQPAPLKVE